MKKRHQAYHLYFTLCFQTVRPSWVKKPESMTRGVTEKAKFKCEAKGFPVPDYKWYINGVQIQGMFWNSKQNLKAKTKTKNSVSRRLWLFRFEFENSPSSKLWNFSWRGKVRFESENNNNVAVSGENELTINNLKMEDTSVIQCNATNKHGHIFENAYLKVGGKIQLHLFSFLRQQ